MSAAVESADPAGDSAPVIREIRIVRQNVFEGVEGGSAFLHRNGNRFHVVSADRVIRREVLVHEGEPLDRDHLEETGRRLRGLSFLEDANVTVEAVGADSVDVVITTRDQWSTIPTLILAGGGGLLRVGGRLDEYNFLGTGKGFAFEGVYENDVGTTWSGKYRDPQILGSNWHGKIGGQYGPLVRGVSMTLNRSPRDLDAVWWGGGGATVTDEVVRLFDEGEEVSRLGEDTRAILANASRSFGERFRKWILSLGYRVSRQDFRALGDETTSPLPKNERLNATSVGLSRVHFSYVEDRWLDNFGRTEDVQLGHSASVVVGRAGFPIPEGERRWELNLQYRFAARPGERHYVVAVASYSSLEVRDKIAAGLFQYYLRWLPRHTLAANFEVVHAEDLRTSEQLVLGGDSGLRGYPARSFNGDRQILINVENRFFPPIDILSVRVGGVVFFDGGNVWRRDRAFDLADMNYSAGFGLRLGFARVPGARIGRIDVGWPLNRAGDAVFTIGVSQHFSLS